MTRFLTSLFLFIALFLSSETPAQTASHAPTPVLTKLNLPEPIWSAGSPKTKTAHSSQRGIPPSIQAVNAITLGSSPNIYGVAFGPKTNLYADPNTNTVMMVYRSASGADGSLAYSYSTNGGTSFTNSSSSSALYVPNTLLGRSRSRFPQGSIYNPTGNTTAANTQANFFAPSLAGLVPSGWGGLVHGAKPLTTGTAVATQENRNSFLIPDGGALNPFDNSFWISSGLYDTAGVYKDSILLGKGIWTSGQYQYTYTNLYFPIQLAPDGTKRFEATNIAWGYNGTGYLAVICHESFNAVPANNFYPVIFKTTDNGLTWNKVAAIDMFSFSTYYQSASAYSTGYDFDLAVDVNNNLHLFAAILPVGATPFTVSDTPGQWGMFDINTTDGGTTWGSFRVASPQSFRGEWNDTQVLFEDNRPQLSKTWNGNRLFYVWFDSDTIGTGARYNNYPNAMVAGLNITTGLIMRDTNTTKTSLVADLCIFGNVSPYTLLNTSTGCHKIPVSIADLGLGTINTTVSNLYLDGIELCNSLFNTTPIPISLTNLLIWAANINGPSVGCQSSSATFSISPLAGATQYLWTVPSGTSILSGQGDTTITVQFGSTSGIINVKAYNTGIVVGSVNATLTAQPISIGLSANATSICRGTSGAIITASGGASYSWTPSTGLNSTTGASVIATPTVSTIYTVIGTASNGCTNSRSISITVLDAPSVSAGALDTTAFCLGDSVGLLARSPDAITYKWIRNGTTILNALDTLYTVKQTGNYRVVVTNANGCTAQSSLITVTVFTPSPIAITVSPSVQFCDSGVVTLSGTGATSYAWTDSITDGAPFSIFTTDTFTVVGTDANGCLDTATARISVTPNPMVEASTAATICRGSTINLRATGAVTYNWSPTTGLGGNTTGDSIVAAPITTTLYTVIGTDSLGCSNSDTVTVFVNPRPTVSVSGNNTICPGTSTTLTATGAANFAWTPLTGLNTATGPSVTASPDSTRNYTVTGTAGNGCTNTATISVIVRQRPSIGITAFPAFEFCGPDSVTLSGTGAVSYTWSGGISNGVKFHLDTTTAFTVTGTDTNGCTNTASIVTAVNELPIITINGAGSLCIGDTVTFIASGATTYNWIPSTGLNIDTGAVVRASPASGTTYTVVGNNGCVDSTTVSLAVNSLPQVNAGADKSVCLGKNVALSASGASSYSWSPATGLNTTTGSTVTASPANTTDYIVSGIDGNGCRKTDTVRVDVLPLPIIGYTVSPSNQLCGGGPVTMNGIGGVSYSWTGGATDGQAIQVNSSTTFTVTGTDANGCTSTANAAIAVNSLPNIVINGTKTICFGDSTTLNALGATTYSWSPATGLSTTTGASVRVSPSTTTTYIVIGDNGCIDTTTVTVTVRSRPNLVISGSAAICEDKNTVLTASGGATFQWSPAAGLNRTDSAVVIASPDSTTLYTVVSTGSNGCTSSRNFTLTVNGVPTVSATGDTTFCLGRTANLSAVGASNYLWSPSSGLNANNLGTVAATPQSTTTYSVIGTNVNGCTDADSVTIIVNQLPQVNAGSDKAICEGGSTTLNVTGAQNFQWSPAIGLSSTVSPTVIASPATTTTYLVVGTDGNGCTQRDTVNVTVNPLPSIIAGPGSSICPGSSVALNANGADSGYSWSPAIGLSATSGSNVTASPAATTTYTVVGTNVTGCSNTFSFTVSIRSTPNISVGNDKFICRGDTASLNASGGISFNWSPSAGLSSTIGSTVQAYPSVNSTYVVTGTGVNGCTAKDTVSVTVWSLPTVQAGQDVSICKGDTTSLTASGASTYTWSPALGLGSTTGVTVTAFPTSTRNYIITGRDSNACRNRDTVAVQVFNLPIVNTGNDISICMGDSITLTSSGALNYTWSPATGLNSSTGNPVIASPAITTVYLVTGTDINGCIDTSDITISVNLLPIVTVSAIPNDTLCANELVSLTGTGAATYQWSSDIQNGIPFPAGSGGIYTVTGTDLNGCTGRDSVLIVALTAPAPTTISGPVVVLAGNTYLYFNNNPSSSILNWSAYGGTISSGQGTDTVTIQWDTTSSHMLMLVQSESNGCSDTTILTVTTNSGTGLSENPTNGFVLYPNPASSTIHMQFADEKLRAVQINDMRGRTVLEQRIKGNKAQLDLPIDLHSGIYLIQVMDGNRTEFIKRLMIERGGN